MQLTRRLPPWKTIWQWSAAPSTHKIPRDWWGCLKQVWEGQLCRETPPKEHRTQPEKSTRLLKKGIQNLGSLEIRHKKYTFLFKFDLAGQMQSGFLKTNMKVLHQKKLKRHRNEWIKAEAWTLENSKAQINISYPKYFYIILFVFVFITIKYLRHHL